MSNLPTRSDEPQLPATRPTSSPGLRFLGWFLITSSVGLVSCQSMFFF
jgi:hypothetical protein